MSLGQKIAGGIVWVALATYIPRLIYLAKVVLLARLLNPEDFGVVGIALTIIGGFSLFGNFGLKPTLIQYRKDIKLASVTSFWLVMAISCSLTWLCIRLAEPLSELLNSPQAAEPLKVIALCMVLDGFGIVPIALLERRLEFQARAACEVITSLASFLVAVYLAIMGQGIWSMVWSQIVSSLALTGSAYFFARWWPKGRPDKLVAWELIGYGRFIIGESLVSFFNQNIDYVSLSRLRGPAELGVYSVAYRLSALSVELVSVMTQVTFPVYAQLQNQLTKVQTLMLRTNRYIAMIAAPLAVYSILFGPVLIPLLLGERWIGAVIPFQLLAILSFFRSINRNLGALLTATGAAKQTLKSTIQSSLFLLVAMPVSVNQWGANGAALALALYAILAFALVLRYVRRSSGLSAQQILLESMLVPSLLSVVAVVPVIITMAIPLPTVLGLGLATVVYMICLASLWYLFLPEDLRLIWEFYGLPVWRLVSKKATR